MSGPMETQSYFCPKCLSDDYSWATGEYLMVHEAGCEIGEPAK